jgi:hypothetical protein
MDILPSPGFVPPEHLSGTTQKGVADLLSDLGDGVGWCLFSIEVRNTYGLPFDITFDRRQEGAPHAVAVGTVAPGCTSRWVPKFRFEGKN